MPPARSSTFSASVRGRVIWLSLGQLISWGTLFYTFALLMEPVERELGMSRAASSLAFSLALLTEGVLGYPVGRLIDAGRGRAVMSAASLLGALALVAISLVHNAVSFYAAWLLAGVAMSGALYTPVFAIVTRRHPQDFRRAIITMTFLGGLASTVFLPVTDALIQGLGWRPALRVLALLHLLVCLPIHLLCLRGEPPARPHATRSATAAPLKAPAFWLVGAFTVLFMGVTSAMPAHMVSMLREQGLSATWVIALPALIGVLQVLGRALLFFFEHRFDVDLANRIIPCLLPASVLVLLAGASMGSSAGMGPAVLFALMWGLGNGMVTIVKGTAIAQYVDREQIAALNGLIALPTALARAAAPLAIGALWSAQDGYKSGLLLLLLMGLLGVLSLVGAQRWRVRMR